MNQIETSNTEENDRCFKICEQLKAAQFRIRQLESQLKYINEQDIYFVKDLTEITKK